MTPESHQSALDEDALTVEATVQSFSSSFEEKRNPGLQFRGENCSQGCLLLLQSILEETPTWSESPALDGSRLYKAFYI